MPYTVRRGSAIESRIEQLARRATMVDLLTGGLDSFIDFQDQLASLQAEIQRDIGALKKTVRKNKQQVLPALEALRRLLWYSRCLGDALAWQVLLFDRKAIAALMRGNRPPVQQETHSAKAVFALAGHLLSQQFGIPIVHDITNWLRIGDITFMRPGEESRSWRFQTVELKSSLDQSRITDEGLVEATVTVNVYSNESLELSTNVDKQTRAALETPTPPETSSKRPYKQDRRLDKQFRRLDQMVSRRDMKDNAITTIDGIPNVVFRLPHADTHRWSDFRRAIRRARRDGFSCFSIDQFIGYGIFYRKEGVSEEHIAKFREPFIEHVQSELLEANGGHAKGFLLVRQIPLKEEYDVEGFPFMRFFSYDIPQIAVADLLRNRLLVTATVNYGRLDAALIDQGFAVDHEDSGYRYSIDVAWPSGETFRLGIPASHVSREVERALYEFSGLDDVVQKVAAVKRLPEMISYEEWGASLESKADDDG